MKLKRPSHPSRVSRIDALNYQQILASAPAPFLILDIDPSFTILDASDAYLRATMTERDEIIGRGLFDVFPDNPNDERPTGMTNLRESLQRVLTQRRTDTMPVQKYDIRRPARVGGGFVERHWSPVNAPVLAEDGSVQCIIHRVEDVTDVVLARKALEREGESRRLEVLVRGQELASANEQLREASEQFKAVYDQGLFAGRLRLDGTVIDVNRASVDICGFDRKDIIDRPFWECGWWNRSPEVQTWVRHAVMQAASGVPFRGESRYFWADGSEHIVDFACMPIRDQSGQVVFVVPTGMDITERVRAAAQQRALDHERARTAALADVGAASAYLAALVDSADDAILSKNLDGIIQSCNAAAEELFGYSADELIGKPVRMLIPPERQAEEDDILARLRRGERIEHFETVRVAKNGRRIEISLTISPVRDASGHIIGASKIARDITAVKQAEADRLRLLEEHARIMATLNEVGAIVAADLDREKVVQAVTDAGTELTTAEFGAFFYNVINERGESYSLYTISGVPREAFSQFPMPRNTAVFEPTFAGTGIVRSDDITRDPRYGHNAPHYGMPRGHLPVRSYLAVPVRGRTGDVIGGLFFGHSDVGRFTEQHERLALGVASWASVALENARLYASVQEASRIKDEFLASLSHELRTPLNAILGYARMLRSGMMPPDKHRKAIDTIERNATSLTQIVEDVLDVSRIVSGKIRLNVQPIELPDVVRNAVDAVAPAADAKGVRLETLIDPDAAPVSGDPERIQQVLWNLLSNAVKFTHRGGKVQVRLERVNSHVEVAVNDSGIGIAPEFLPHVFERFRQADATPTRERGGLGLGLSIARQLTEMHGGTLEAFSEGLGRGSTFRLTMPLTVLQSERTQGPRVHPRAEKASRTIPSGVLNGVHVLAVDDEKDSASLVAEVLESTGARVTTAHSVEEALERIEAEVPHVVVADLGMPHLDGFDLIERIRRHRDAAVREIPAAALTAFARSEDRVKALRSGFQIHLAKPIDPAELVTTVASLAKRFLSPPDVE
jgi:PAS domain S-box-containing protein